MKGDAAPSVGSYLFGAIVLVIGVLVPMAILVSDCDFYFRLYLDWT